MSSKLIGSELEGKDDVVEGWLGGGELTSKGFWVARWKLVRNSGERDEREGGWKPKGVVVLKVFSSC